MPTTKTPHQKQDTPKPKLSLVRCKKPKENQLVRNLSQLADDLEKKIRLLSRL